MREDDLLKFRWIADPRISPDGTRVAFTLVRVTGQCWSSHANVANAITEPTTAT